MLLVEPGDYCGPKRTCSVHRGARVQSSPELTNKKRQTDADLKGEMVQPLGQTKAAIRCAYRGKWCAAMLFSREHQNGQHELITNRERQLGLRTP